MSDIDIIRAAINGDAQAVITAQIGSIQREIVQRLAINITTREAIHELISGVRHTKLQLEPAHDGLPDDQRDRHERLLMEHEYRSFVVRLTEEQRSCWNDVQRLKTELRGCERELLALQKRDRRQASIK
jgi:hypothetical protein